MAEEKKPPTIQELYPDLSPEEQEQAERFLRDYVLLIKRIHERIEREEKGEDFDEIIRLDRRLSDD
jgi:hypothetical protein